GRSERVRALEPAAPMSIGQVNARFLSEAAGAHGAALWRPDVDGAGADINKRPVTAFAVSYAQRRDEAAEAQIAGQAAGQAAAGQAAQAQTAGPGTVDASARAGEDGEQVFAVTGGEDATELTVGSIDGNVQDLRSLVARLSVDTPVVVEVTDAMETESALVEELLASGSARILTSDTTLVRDPQNGL